MGDENSEGGAQADSPRQPNSEGGKVVIHPLDGTPPPSGSSVNPSKPKKSPPSTKDQQGVIIREYKGKPRS